MGIRSAAVTVFWSALVFHGQASSQHCSTGQIEHPTILGLCLMLVTEKTKYQSASQECVSFGGQLVAVYDHQIQTAVETLLETHGEAVYIGADKETEDFYTWKVDQTHVTWTNWVGGEEPHGQNGLKCIKLEPYTWVWYKVTCNKKLAFICQIGDAIVQEDTTSTTTVSTSTSTSESTTTVSTSTSTSESTTTVSTSTSTSEPITIMLTTRSHSDSTSSSFSSFPASLVTNLWSTVDLTLPSSTYSSTVTSIKTTDSTSDSTLELEATTTKLQRTRSSSNAISTWLESVSSSRTSVTSPHTDAVTSDNHGTTSLPTKHYVTSTNYDPLDVTVRSYGTSANARIWDIDLYSTGEAELTSDPKTTHSMFMTTSTDDVSQSTAMKSHWLTEVSSELNTVTSLEAYAVTPSAKENWVTSIKSAPLNPSTNICASQRRAACRCDVKESKLLNNSFWVNGTAVRRQKHTARFSKRTRWDGRKSSSAIGFIGLAAMCVLFLSIVIPDFIAFLCHLEVLKNSTHNEFSESFELA